MTILNSAVVSHITTYLSKTVFNCYLELYQEDRLNKADTNHCISTILPELSSLQQNNIIFLQTMFNGKAFYFESLRG